MSRIDEKGAPYDSGRLQCEGGPVRDVGSSINQCVARSLDASVRSAQVPGLVAIVTSCHELLYAGAFGTADIEEPRPLAIDAIFRVASLTKIITSIATVQLIEQGAISLDDNVEAYLPQFRDMDVLESEPGLETYRLRLAKCKPTILHLLTHTSGFGYDFTARALNQLALPGESTKPGPLLFDPGERWLYGASTEWLGHVVEKITGLPLEEYFRIYILDPLGMHDTGFAVPEHKRARLVTVTRRSSQGELVKDDIHQWPGQVAPVGDSGLFSTTQDFMQVVRMFLNNGEHNGLKVLSARGAALMAQNHIGNLGVSALKSTIPEYSADFNFISDMQDKWSLGFLVTADCVPGKRSKGSLSWAGILNTYLWIDHKLGIGGLLFLQLLPFADKWALELYDSFERAVYASIAGASPGECA